MIPLPSEALDRWKAERCGVLDNLEQVHAKVTQRKIGRQYMTEHLNAALFVRLATEFQGFCRDLHDDAATVLADSFTTGDNETWTDTVRNALVRQRKLGLGNANSGNLGNDFAVLGMTFWPDIYAQYPSWGPKWNGRIDALNTVRNAVVHSDEVQLKKFKADTGVSLNLATFKQWRGTLNSAAIGFDRVVRAYLK